MSSSGVRPAYIKTAEDRILVVDKPSQTVGREEGADLIIADKSISRVHAVLAWDGTVWNLEDLESRNKTFINEKAIPPKTPMPLTDGCTVHFGYVKVSFHLGVPQSMQADAGATVAIDINELRRQQEAAANKGAAPAKPAPAPEPASPGMPSVGVGGTMIMKTVKRGDAASHPPDALGYLELASVDKAIRLYIRSTIVKIGTDAKECDLLINEREADAEHAEIRYQRDQTVQLKNLSSSYGTWVDGRRVAKADLKQGMMIKIGDSTFIFHHIKHPVFDEDKNAGTRAVVRFLIVAVLFLVAAGGGWFVYVQSNRKKGPEVLTGVRPEVKRELLDLVNTQKYKRVLERIEEITASADIDDDTKALAASYRDNVKILADAQDALSKKGGVPKAYQLVHKVGAGEVADAAKVDIEDMKAKFGRYVTDLSGEFAAAEDAGSFDKALTEVLPELLRYDEPGAAKWQQAERRVVLKKKMTELYTRGIAAMKTDFDKVRDDAAQLVKDGEAIIAADAGSAASLQPFLDRTKNVLLDADFMRAYFAFDASGSTDVIRSIYASISEDYDKDGKEGGRRKDMENRLAILDRSIALHKEFETTLLALKGMKPDTSLVEKLDVLMDNRNEAIRLERDTRFAVRTNGLKELDELESYKKQAVTQIWTQQPTNYDKNTALGRIMAALETRERAHLTLRMFPREARIDRDDLVIVANWVRDPDLQEIFKEANRAYNSSRTDATQAILETYKTTKDKEILDNTENYLTRIVNATIPEDNETVEKVDSLRLRLKNEFN